MGFEPTVGDPRPTRQADARTLAAMSPEDAAAHVEIQQVLQRYGQALDEKRYELLDEVFAAGAILDYEMNGGQPSTVRKIPVVQSSQPRPWLRAIA